MSDALYEPMFDGAGNVVGLLFVGIPTRAYDTILSQALHMMCAVAGVVGTFVIFGAVLAVRRGLRPLAEVTDAVSCLAEGKLHSEICHTSRKDEVGKIAQALEIFRDAAIRNQALEAEERHNSESERARSKRSARVTNDFQNKILAVLGSTDKMVADLEASAGAMSASVGEISRQVAQSSEIVVPD
jgi:methyl-accepting chemotaxis protein